MDPDGRRPIERDKNGKIIFTPVGGPVNIKHGGDRINKNGVPVQPGYLRADDGRKIEAFKNLSSDKRYDTDCHGVTFADGEYWINNDQVQNILKGDNYQTTSKPEQGNVAVFSTPNSGIQHSVSVVSVKNGDVTVSGLGGLETDVHQDKIQNAWPDPAASVTYYYKEEKAQGAK